MQLVLNVITGIARDADSGSGNAVKFQIDGVWSDAFDLFDSTEQGDSHVLVYDDLPTGELQAVQVLGTGMCVGQGWALGGRIRSDQMRFVRSQSDKAPPHNKIGCLQKIDLVLAVCVHHHIFQFSGPSCLLLYSVGLGGCCLIPFHALRYILLSVTWACCWLPTFVHFVHAGLAWLFLGLCLLTNHNGCSL